MGKKGGGFLFAAQNLNGGNEFNKRNATIKRMKSYEADLFALINTRFAQHTQTDICRFEEYLTFFAGNSSNSRGITVYVNPAADIQINNTISDEEGNYLLLEAKLGEIPTLLISVYGPNQDSPEFWINLFTKADELNYEHVLYLGDLNVTLDPKMDNYNYSGFQNPRTRRLINKLIDEDEICDTFRRLHPNTKEYTYKQFSMGGRDRIRRARLYMALATPNLMNNITHVTHVPAFRKDLDHGTLLIEVNFDSFKPGKGYFRTPPHIHTDPDYIEQINKTIDNTITDHLQHNDNTPLEVNTDPTLFAYLPSTASPGTLFEVIISACKTTSLNFVTHRNTRLKKEKQGLEDAVLFWERMVTQNPEDGVNWMTLDSCKQKLTEYENKREKEDMLRLKEKFIFEGEKPSKWFLNLCKRKSASKVIGKLIIEEEVQTPEGVETKKTEITDQKKIIEATGTYYEQLFKKIETTKKIDEFYMKITIK